MKVNFSILTLFLFLFPNFVFAYDDFRYENHIRVGVFQNDPVTYHERDEALGLYPAIIKYIAKNEGWEIEWVFCGFAECLELMQQNKVDIMTSIVDTEERRTFATFSKVPVWDYYGIIFSHDPGVTGLFDLEGKKIGGRGASVYTLELVKLLESFSINAEIVPYDDYDVVFEDLNKKVIDIAAVNNTFSYTKRDFGHVYQTPIVYSPFSSVWATPKGSIHESKLLTIDRYMAEIKTDKSSLFYQFKEEWFAKISPFWTLKRIFLLIILPILIVILVMIAYHYYTTIIMNLKLKSTIRERDKADSNLAKQEEFLNTVLDAMPALLSVYDYDRNPIRRNKKHYETFGIEDDNYTLNKSVQLVTDDYVDVLEDLFKLDLGDNRSNVRIDIISQNDEILPHEYSVTPFTWDNQQLLMFIGMDIADRVKTQSDKEKLESRLRQAQKMEAIGTLAGGIAHDFNNVLTIILGYVELVYHDIQDFKENYAPEAFNEEIIEALLKRANASLGNLEIALGAADKAKTLIHQILAFSRQGKANRIKLNVEDSLNEAIVMIRQTLPTTIEIKTNISADVGHIYADATQFQQLIMNMCINSFHAMEEDGGTLSIALHRVTMDDDDLLYEDDVQAGNFAKISIRDTGCGIPKDIKDKIFNPYFTTKDVNKGTGMGLSIVHGIVKQYGGFIHLYSEVGQGAVFNIFIPMYNGESQVTQLSKIQDLTGDEKILIVDDEPLIANVNKMLLENFGYDVSIQTNSLEALNEFADDPNQYDLVITDQTMPTITGFDLSVKMLEIRPDIPIILCSGYSSILTDTKIRESGIREFALKPILKNDLAKLIRKILG